ncbi:MAG: hypothetical protein RQM92_03630 [Candidatus Syntrophopropionicum ammoniitolerans]
MAQAGSRIALDQDVNIEILWPEEGKNLESDADLNNSSLVIKVTYGHRSFIFTGDAELAEQKELLRAGVDLASDVLKVLITAVVPCCRSWWNRFSQRRR